MPSTTSPLRYPGGKSCLLNLISTILNINKSDQCAYAEPYAGGCGLALSLLFNGHVSDIHINDIDPSIWAFWHCVLNETESLIALVQSTPVTIDEWFRQRDIHREQNNTDTLKLGFSTFFLNRTNRSGIIKKAGVIGGLNQKGNYNLDCRYNHDVLIKKINRIKQYSDRIHLTNLDAMVFLENDKGHMPDNTFFFIDPPYYKKGESLYTSFYKPDDHTTIAKKILELEHQWILTYDDAPEIRKLYREQQQYYLDIRYSLQTKRLGTELIIASKKLRMPPEIKSKQITYTENHPHQRARA